MKNEKKKPKSKLEEIEKKILNSVKEGLDPEKKEEIVGHDLDQKEKDKFEEELESDEDPIKEITDQWEKEIEESEWSDEGKDLGGGVKTSPETGTIVFPDDEEYEESDDEVISDDDIVDDDDVIIPEEDTPENDKPKKDVTKDILDESDLTYEEIYDRVKKESVELIRFRTSHEVGVKPGQKRILQYGSSRHMVNIPKDVVETFGLSKGDVFSFWFVELRGKTYFLIDFEKSEEGKPPSVR